MGKNLRGGYKLIPFQIDLDQYEGQDAVVSGIYSKIKSTKKRIVLTALIVAGVLMGDLSVEVELKSNGKLFISNAYGYDLTISSDDKVSVASHVDSSVVANPTLAGTEDNLSGLEVNGTKYKVPSGTEVSANPTLAGTEDGLSGLEVAGTKYKVPKGTKLYLHVASITVNDVSYAINIISTSSESASIVSVGGPDRIKTGNGVILNACLTGNLSIFKPTFYDNGLDTHFIMITNVDTTPALSYLTISAISDDTVTEL